MKRGPALTIGVLEVLSAVLAEAEAGGYEAVTQHLDDRECLRFEKNAERARAWIQDQIDRRE
jgi:hypothetical protein